MRPIDEILQAEADGIDTTLPSQRYSLTDHENGFFEQYWHGFGLVCGMANNTPPSDISKANGQTSVILEEIEHRLARLLYFKATLETRGKRVAAASDYQYDLAYLHGMLQGAEYAGFDVRDLRNRIPM